MGISTRQLSVTICEESSAVSEFEASVIYRVISWIHHILWVSTEVCEYIVHRPLIQQIHTLWRHVRTVGGQHNLIHR